MKLNMWFSCHPFCVDPTFRVPGGNSSLEWVVCIVWGNHTNWNTILLTNKLYIRIPVIMANCRIKQRVFLHKILLEESQKSLRHSLGIEKFENGTSWNLNTMNWALVFQNPPVIPCEDRYLDPPKTFSGDVCGFKHRSSQGIWKTRGGGDEEHLSQKLSENISDDAYKVGPLPVITGFITPITRVIRTVSHL